MDEAAAAERTACRDRAHAESERDQPNDALRFASWAIQFGETPPENIKLLLSPQTPLPGSVRIPKTDFVLRTLEATSRGLKAVLQKCKT